MRGARARMHHFQDTGTANISRVHRHVAGFDSSHDIGANVAMCIREDGDTNHIVRIDAQT